MTFSGFTTEVPEVDDIVSLGKYLDLEVDDHDINELVDEDKEEMTTEELLLFQERQYTNVTEKIKKPEIEENLSEELPTSDIKGNACDVAKSATLCRKNTTHKN